MPDIWVQKLIKLLKSRSFRVTHWVPFPGPCQGPAACRILVILGGTFFAPPNSKYLPTPMYLHLYELTYVHKDRTGVWVCLCAHMCTKIGHLWWKNCQKVHLNLGISSTISTQIRGKGRILSSTREKRLLLIYWCRVMDVTHKLTRSSIHFGLVDAGSTEHIIFGSCSSTCTLYKWFVYIDK